MLTIILGILKTAGLVIGVILGLLLLLLLLVLLVPIRYRAEGSYQEKLKGSAGVSWLLHILSLTVRYEEELQVKIRVFGILIGGRKEKAEAETESAKTGSERQADGKMQSAAHQGQETAEAEPVQEESKAPGSEKKPEKAEPESAKKRAPESVVKPGADEGKPDAEKSEPAAGKPQSVHRAAKPEKQMKKPGKAEPKKAGKKPDKPRQSFPEKIRVTYEKICDKLKSWKDQKEKLSVFLHDEDNQRTFRLLKRQIFRLLKAVLPRKLTGRLKFGFDDPYTTGQVLMYASPFYGLYAKHLQLIPVFEEPVLEGELKLKGHIRIATLLIIAVRVWMDKNVHRFVKKWRES